MFDEHKVSIEDSAFQVQFGAIGGYSVLQLVLESHKFVRSLIASIDSGTVSLNEIEGRIQELLPLADANHGDAWDGSIVVYLYCLYRRDLLAAYRASGRILDTHGLFWSRWMAHKIIILVQQIEQSLDISSLDGGSDVTHIADNREMPETRSSAMTSIASLAGDADRSDVHTLEFSTAA